MSSQALQNQFETMLVIEANKRRFTQDELDAINLFHELCEVNLNDVTIYIIDKQHTGCMHIYIDFFTREKQPLLKMSDLLSSIVKNCTVTSLTANMSKEVLYIRTYLDGRCTYMSERYDKQDGKFVGLDIKHN